MTEAMDAYRCFVAFHQAWLSLSPEDQGRLLAYLPEPYRTDIRERLEARTERLTWGDRRIQAAKDALSRKRGKRP